MYRNGWKSNITLLTQHCIIWQISGKVLKITIWTHVHEYWTHIINASTLPPFQHMQYTHLWYARIGQISTILYEIYFQVHAMRNPEHVYNNYVGFTYTHHLYAGSVFIFSLVIRYKSDDVTYITTCHCKFFNIMYYCEFFL